jgi:hypothetical protein
MPKFVSFVVARLAAGAGLGWTLILILAGSDHPLLELIQRSGDTVALGMLIMAFGGTFGLAYLSTALLFQDEE